MPFKVFDLQSACDALRAGNVVAFPTETFYGLGCDALNPDAIGTVYVIKRRPYRMPLPVVIGDMTDIERVAVNISPTTRKLMNTFWPGSLSILFTASPDVPDLLTAGTGRIAVRFSPHPDTIALCRTSRCVLTASSANVSGNPPVTSPEDLDPALGDRLAGVFVTPSAPGGGSPSTIVELLANGSEEVVRVLREGSVSIDTLRAAGFGVVTIDG